MNYMGMDGFVWFQGVVEDRNDPEKLGRCRVRCLGFHTSDLIEIPTDTLPWATLMQPITSAAMNGIGETPLGPVEGTWVIGFFRDGEEAQYPVIMGTIAGIPEELSTGKQSEQVGFFDPNEKYPRKEKINEPDLNRLARPGTTFTKPDYPLPSGSYNTVVEKKLDELDKGVSISAGGTWDEKGTPYATEYPYNHVKESESGHIHEWDDTPGAERTHDYHTSGTFTEVHPDGTTVNKIFGEEYKIVHKTKNEHIKGDYNLTIDGNFHIQVGGKLIIHNGGESEIVSGGNHKTVAPRIDFNP